MLDLLERVKRLPVDITKINVGKLARENGLNKSTLRGRLLRGKSLQEALRGPVQDQTPIRRIAEEEGRKTYHGSPCAVCECTERYSRHSSSSRCINKINHPITAFCTTGSIKE